MTGFSLREKGAGTRMERWLPTTHHVDAAWSSRTLGWFLYCVWLSNGTAVRLCRHRERAVPSLVSSGWGRQLGRQEEKSPRGLSARFLLLLESTIITYVSTKTHSEIYARNLRETVRPSMLVRFETGYALLFLPFPMHLITLGWSLFPESLSRAALCKM